MTDDIIKRAEIAAKLPEVGLYERRIIAGLLAALKAAQQTIERNQVAIALRERELKVARAENERLRNYSGRLRDGVQ